MTDVLRLGLHQAEDTNDRAFRMLESGQEMEILSRTRLYAQVQLPDGTQGYVKAAYLVSEKPARLVVAEAEAATAQVQQELEAVRAALADPAQTIDALNSEVAGLTESLAQANAQLDGEKAERQRLESRQEQYRYSLPVSWVLAAIIACLIGGFLFGLWWVDQRSRKRHGGIRIY
ncbi:MAG: TIGR04211 family SH3 domain-containing protein [Woeseiaceae bacterium]|nr:TIGR04211 family SH3 domain-containing protein [Woeseiaceae bacterium]